MTMCDTCNSACCRGVGWPPWEDGELDGMVGIIRDAQISIERGRVCIGTPGDCCHLEDDGRCYLRKEFGSRAAPRMCRDFEVGGKHCLNVRRKYLTGAG